MFGRSKDNQFVNFGYKLSKNKVFEYFAIWGDGSATDFSKLRLASSIFSTGNPIDNIYVGHEKYHISYESQLGVLTPSQTFGNVYTPVATDISPSVITGSQNSNIIYALNVRGNTNNSYDFISYDVSTKTQKTIFAEGINTSIVGIASNIWENNNTNIFYFCKSRVLTRYDLIKNIKTDIFLAFNPTGICMDKDNNVYVAGGKNLYILQKQ